MKQFCNYHPTKLAHWNCHNCALSFCPDCVSKRPKGGYTQNEYLFFCPKCNQETEWVGAANLIDPFWVRLPKIFAYPFSIHPFIVIAIYAFAAWILSGFVFAFGLLHMAAWLMVLKYSFESLKATARGNLKPPPIESETIYGDFFTVIKQSFIYIAIFLGFGWVSFKLGLFMGIVFLICALFFVPAMIILLVTTESFFAAINPALFVPLAFRIGWGYLLMYFFLLLLAGAPAYLFQSIIHYLPEALHALLQGFAKSYYTIISYHLMGYVILQYHERIGYKVEHEDFADPAAEDAKPVVFDPDQTILNEVEPLIQEGKLDQAIALIQNKAAIEGIKGVILAERYYNLLKMRKQVAELSKHGINYLDLLINKNQRRKALSVYQECQHVDPKFIPSIMALFKLAGWMNETGKTKESVSTYNRLLKAYPDHPLVPKAYFRVAQIFHDRMMNTDKARQILSVLKKKYPDHEIIPQVKNYLANL